MNLAQHYQPLGIATNVINDLEVHPDVILPINPNALALNSVSVSVIKMMSHIVLPSLCVARTSFFVQARENGAGLSARRSLNIQVTDAPRSSSDVHLR